MEWNNNHQSPPVGIDSQEVIGARSAHWPWYHNNVVLEKVFHEVLYQMPYTASRIPTSTWLLWSRALAKSSIVNKSWVLPECFSLKPNWVNTEWFSMVHYLTGKYVLHKIKLKTQVCNSSDHVCFPSYVYNISFFQSCGISPVANMWLNRYVCIKANQFFCNLFQEMCWYSIWTGCLKGFKSERNSVVYPETIYKAQQHKLMDSLRGYVLKF